jgi:hypothetical protein
MRNSSARDVVHTVVLGCAKDDRLLLPPMLEGLVAAGFEVEVASGLQQRGDPLLAAAARLREAAYVLLASVELPAALAEQLRTRLVQAGIPAARIVVLAMDESSGAIDVAERLAALGMSASHVRRPTSVRLGAVQALVQPSSAAFPPPTTVPPLPDGARTRMHAPVSASVPVLDVELEDAGVPRHRKAIAIVAASIAVIGLVAFVGSRGDASEPSQDDTAAARASWSALYDRVRSSQLAEAPPVIEPAPSIAPAPEPAPPLVIAGTVPAATAAPLVAAPAIVVAAPTPAVNSPVVVAPAPLAAIDEPVLEEVEPMVDEVEIQSIYAGLVGQKFRALDILLVSPEPRKRKGKRVYKTPAKMGWLPARSYCEKLEIEGVADWRLPRVGELGSLTAGELLPDGKFWSQTEGDTFGRSRVVWNTKTVRMGTAPVKWSGGRVVCVRTLAKAPTLPAK